jgi:ribulose-bisphosphate carboxylase large chain
VIRATFELEPHGSAEALALEESVGMAGGPDAVRGRVVAEEGGRAVVEFPAANWGRNVPLLLSALVANEAVEDRAFTRCRLVGLELPEGLLPGPAFPPAPAVGVGVIVKPSLGLAPAEVADVVAAAVRGGACLVKDDELLGDPEWCPLEERVRAVAKVLEPGVVYCANVTGPSAALLERAQRAVEAGATGLMVNAFTQGLDSVLALRDAGLGVPVLAHRVGSGPLVRNGCFGASGATLARLTRLCGADYVMAGAFGGRLFDSDDDVGDQIEAIRGPCGAAPASTPVLGGGVGPAEARRQADGAGGEVAVVLLGSRAYVHPGGLEAGVRAAVDAVRR